MRLIVAVSLSVKFSKVRLVATGSHGSHHASHIHTAHSSHAWHTAHTGHTAHTWHTTHSHAWHASHATAETAHVLHHAFKVSATLSALGVAVILLLPLGEINLQPMLLSFIGQEAGPIGTFLNLF